MTAVIALGILAWILLAILLALFLGRVSRLNRPRTAPVELPPPPRIEKTVLEPPIGITARFPAEPTRFVGRATMMAAASAALAPASGRAAVMFHGMAGSGKTTCALELAYRGKRGFGTLAFWSAPSDPDQFSDALRLLAVALDAQLGDHGLAMAEEVATQKRLENFLPTLTTVFADAGLLLVLDQLDTLLTPDGQWRDPRWTSLIGALTSHRGQWRVIMTSRIMPTGLSSETVLIQPTPPLSWAESLWLVRRQPTLRALLHTVALGQRVLTLTQGHPALLELAAAAAVDPARLAYQLTEIDAAVDDAALDKAALAAFVTDGNTKLDAEQLQRIFTAWTLTVAATAPAPARLLLQVLCQLEESDRNTAVVGANWAALWQHLGQPGEPPPLASSVAALAAIALIVIDPLDEHTDPHEPVRYRIHSGVVETINSMTPAPVTAAVNAQLAAWWTAVVVGWAIEPPQAGLGSQLTVRASLAAARYLLRQHDWKAASCLLERALIQDSYSPGTCLATTPLLRRIAEGTGVLKDLVVLGAALRKVDADEAETVLHCAYDRAAADGNYQLASTTAGELVTVLRDQGRLHEALTLANQKIEHTSRAGFGSWTQLSDQGRRLQILHLLGHHEQVLTELPALRAQMAELPDHRAHNDRVNPWNAREGILDVGRWSAMTLKRWDDALKLNREIVDTRRRRGSTPQQIARIQFNDYIPLLRLGRLTDADHLLRECQDAFGTAGDMTQLAVIYSARANLEDKRDHPADAVDLQRTSLHLRYTHPEPYEIARAHHNLADYLARAAGEPAEQRAHRLAASLLYYLTGNTAELTRTLAALASELDGETSDPALPTTLSEIACLVDADDGVRFGDLVITLCPDPAAASHALADFLTTTAA